MVVVGPPAVAKTAEAAATDRYLTSQDSVADYHLGVGDKLRITVFNEPTISGEFAVSANGTLSLPLVGDIAAADKTATEVAASVQAALANGYIRSPQVSAEVSVYRPFFILGEVKAPGPYPYTVGLTVYNAIATAQGFTPRANRKTVLIRKVGATQEEPYKVTPDLRILPGDTVRVPERYF